MSTVYVVVTKEGDDSSISRGFFDQLSVADHLFLLQISDTDEVNKNTHLTRSDLASHKTKRKMSTFISGLSDENLVDETIIEKLANADYSLILGESVEDNHVQAVAKFLKNGISVDANSSVAKFIEECEEGDTTIGAYIEGGMITEIEDPDVIAESSYEHKSGFDTKSVTEANAKQFIKFIKDATEFDGFNPLRVIKKLLGNVDDPNEQATIITLILSAYIRVGNNMQKLNTKRKNEQVSRELLQLMQKLGVTRHTKTSDGVTLARIAIAMPGELLVMRRVMQMDLQNQVETSLDVVYQDLAFQGVPEISKMPGYEKYAIDFSSLIYRKKNGAPDEIGVSESDMKEWPEFMKSFNSWNNVAKTGYKKNNAAIQRFAEADAIGMGGDLPVNAFEFFKSSAAHYLKED